MTNCLIPSIFKIFKAGQISQRTVSVRGERSELVSVGVGTLVSVG